LERTLVIGYGNPDRQDDGVAWHILAALAQRLGQPVPVSIDDEYISANGMPDLAFDLQLTPEFAEIIAGYQRVCFIDAHTANIQDEIRVVEVKGEYQASPFTHHLTPASCLAMVHTLYQKHTTGILVSVRGYEFGFSHSLSRCTQSSVVPAVEKILEWLGIADEA
jgi:hydrogenase maturation protease